MRRLLATVGAVGAALALTAGVALAAITFHSGPTVTFSGASATATFNISGLGNSPARADLSVSGSATWGCKNHGKNVSPGHPQTTATGGTNELLTNSQKNGRSDVSLTATLATPPTPTPQDIGCPNPAGNWTVYLVSLSAVTATLTIEQPIGTIIFGPQTYP